jgi:hypothetical protein
VAEGALKGPHLPSLPITVVILFFILWVWSFQQAGAVLVGAVGTPGMVYGLLRNKSFKHLSIAAAAAVTVHHPSFRKSCFDFQ